MRHLLTILAVLTLSACSHFSQNEDETMGWDAERLYAEAKGKLDAGYYSNAVQLYQKLEARYPFGRHAQQALLDIAYTHYKNEEPDAAIAACERFIKLYPQNLHIDYVYYLKGLANFSRGMGLIQRLFPTDKSQRDSGIALRAFQDFSELVSRFPNSEYVEDAEQRMRYLRNNLAQHEVYVATYYMRRRAFVSAANRAIYVVENYSRTPSLPDALVILAKAYRVLELDDLAEDALRVLEHNYPNYPGIYEVKAVKIVD